MPNNLDVQLSQHPDVLVRTFFDAESVGDIAALLEVPRNYLVWALYRERLQDQYITFTVPKRSGGEREIAAPNDGLKILQRKLNAILQLVYRRRPPVHGFVPGMSILTNARRHIRRRFVLNVDLLDFFPSIQFRRVRGLFAAKPYELNPNAAIVLAQICCFNGTLPQGAPTSPIVSNMICARLDYELTKLAKRYKCTYTRYADDLTFSTSLRTFPPELAMPEGGVWSGENLVLGDELVSVIESNDFRINTEKQRLLGRGGRQEVTGLTVNEFPNVRRRYVRQIRAMLHDVRQRGWDVAGQEFFARWDRSHRNPDWRQPDFQRILRGKLDFLKMVKGEGDPTFRKLANELHDLDKDLMPHYPVPPADPSNPWAHWLEEYKNLIFQLEVRDEKGDIASGTAFAWRQNWLATAGHNVNGTVTVSPPLPEDTTLLPQHIVHHPAGDERIDVAAIDLSTWSISFGRAFPVRTDPLNHAEEIAVLGYPKVPLREPALGIYSGVVESRAFFFGGAVETFQVTAEVAGGMSGGPVIDRSGKLVGIAMETTFEQTEEGVPARPFHHILPVHFLLEIREP